MSVRFGAFSIFAKKLWFHWTHNWKPITRKFSFLSLRRRRCQTVVAFSPASRLFSLCFWSFSLAFKFIVDSVSLVREAFHSRMNLCTCRASQNHERENFLLLKRDFRFNQCQTSRRMDSVVPIKSHRKEKLNYGAAHKNPITRQTLFDVRATTFHILCPFRNLIIN